MDIVSRRWFLTLAIVLTASIACGLNRRRNIRRRRSDIVLTTDIICGFCTETEDEFLDTVRVVDEVPTYRGEGCSFL